MSRRHPSTRRGPSPSPAAARKVRVLVPLLLRWFARQARDLPWRRTRDPYAIWISEIMLQQTQVKTVLPYWDRWMKALPDAQSLATAPPERVLKLWEGLGYYTRARNLQKAARQVMAEHHGRFPATFAEVLALPGIGRYTAGAICSIAFGQATPLLDGNVMRVLTRLFAIARDPRSKQTNDLLWLLATALVEHAASAKLETRNRKPETPPASLLNQSLMELGALVCTPRQPRCPECPVRGCCDARRLGRQGEIPRKARPVPSTARRFLALVIERHGRYLVRQRPTDVVNASLWEFPNAEVSPEETPEQVAARVLGFIPQAIHPLCVVKHTITRFRITVDAFAGKASSSAQTSSKAGQWLRLSELDPLPFTRAHRRILEAKPE